MSADTDLPFVDEHRVLVSAPAPAVWDSMIKQVHGLRRDGVENYARLVGAQPRRAAGEPLGEGSTLPGFTVAEAVPGQRARLTGRHRFSRYTLAIDLDARPDGTLLSARTYAEFPGLHGAAYRLLVIASGAHRLLVGRLLRTIRRQAESHS